MSGGLAFQVHPVGACSAAAETRAEELENAAARRPAAGSALSRAGYSQPELSGCRDPVLGYSAWRSCAVAAAGFPLRTVGCSRP